MAGMEWGDDVHALIQRGPFSVQDVVDLGFSLREALVICQRLLTDGTLLELGEGLYRCRGRFDQ